MQYLPTLAISNKFAGIKQLEKKFWQVYMLQEPDLELGDASLETLPVAGRVSNDLPPIQSLPARGIARNPT